MSRFLVAVVATLAVASCAYADGTLKKTLLGGNAKCLDGSSAGYYFEKSATGSKNWVVFLQGGGVCHTISGCIARSKTALGSSKNWPATFEDTNNILSANCTLNPFCNDNHVWMPYCSGDVYLGQETKADPFGLLFAGHLNLEAVITDLQVTHGLGDGTGHSLLLAGSSAGGLGTFNNADFVTDMLPSVSVKANPQGGFFFPNITAYPYWAAGAFEYPENATELELFDAFRDESCVKEAADPILCNDVFTLYQYIKTPLFVAENQYDSNQIFAQLLAPKSGPKTDAFVSYFGSKMREALTQVVAPNGLYAPSCLCHTSDLNLETAPAVDGVTMGAGLKSWYFSGQDVRVEDDCGDMPCNPDCPSTCISL